MPAVAPHPDPLPASWARVVLMVLRQAQDERISSLRATTPGRPYIGNGLNKGEMASEIFLSYGCGWSAMSSAIRSAASNSRSLGSGSVPMKLVKADLDRLTSSSQ